MKTAYTPNRLVTVATLLIAALPAYVTAATEIFNTTVTVDIPEPTCSISVPAKVELGILTAGMKINWLPDIQITVDCKGNSVKHGVYMQSQNEQPSSRDGIYLKRTNDNSNSGVLLKIVGSNGNDKLTHDEKNPSYIHEGTTGTTYPTKILVDVSSDAKAGGVSGTVTFKLTYPA
ncbi:TPA: fimbrial protein [Escherichia coli]